MNALFGFSGRMRRRSFALWTAMLWVLMVPIGLAAGMLAVTTQGEDIQLTRGAPGALLLTALLLFTYIQTALSAKRLHDFGWSGWQAVLVTLNSLISALETMLPLEVSVGSAVAKLGGVLFFGALLGMPPTNGDNRYGPDPRRTSFRLTASDLDQPKASRAEQAMDELIRSRAGDRPSFGRR